MNLCTKNTHSSSILKGLWDQLGALKWIKKNIAAFGGNPNRITIFGESAGGWSVSYQLASHQSKNHFNAAIIQSGSLDLSGMVKFDQTKAIPEVHQGFIENIGCQINGVKMTDTVKCVEEKSVEEVMDKSHMFDECNSK